MTIIVLTFDMVDSIPCQALPQTCEHEISMKPLSTVLEIDCQIRNFGGVLVRDIPRG